MIKEKRGTSRKKEKAKCQRIRERERREEKPMDGGVWRKEKVERIIDEQPTYLRNVISPLMEARVPVLASSNELATRFTCDLEH